MSIPAAVPLERTVAVKIAPALWAGLLLLGAPPGADEARQLQSLYRAEKESAVKAGADAKFPPQLLQKADQMARRGDAALEAGRLLQASTAFRQARWQLPYLSPEVPEHVGRVLGNLRLRHAQEIDGLAWSPDGRRLATASKDRTVAVWDLGNGHEALRYLGHPDYVRAVAYSPDGKLVASAGGESDVRLWDPATGKDVRSLKGEGTFITCLAFSRDGKYLVAGCDDRAVRIWEVADGKLKRAIQDFRAIIQAVAFSPDGSTLAVGVGDGEVRLWQYPKLVEDVRLPAYWSQQDFSGPSYNVSFSPDGKVLARSGPDGVKLYNVPPPGSPVRPGAPRRTFQPPRDTTGKARQFTCTTFSRDGRALYVGCSDGLVYLYDPDNGQSLGTFRGHTGAVKALALHPGGGRGGVTPPLLASASADHTVRFWQLAGTSQSRDLVGHQGPVWTAFFSHDGQRLVSASADRTVKVWEAGTGRVLHTLGGARLGVTTALFSPDGKTILSAGGDKVLNLWDADTGRLRKTLEGHQGTVTCADFSGDGKIIVSGSADQKIKLRDAVTGKELRTLADQPSVVAAVAFSPDGKRVASGHIDQTVRLWDVATGKLQHSWPAHGAAVAGVAFSPDGKLLASCGADQLVKVWTLANLAAPPVIFSGHTGPVSSVAFRPDSRFVVSAGSDQVVRLWKLADGSTKDAAQDFRGHKDWISSVAFNPDGYYIASASADRTVKIWEVTSRELPTLPEHTGAVLAVAVSPDGKVVASGGTDRTIKLWDRATGVETQTLTGHADDVVALAFTPDGKTLVSASADRSLKRWDLAAGKELPLEAGHQQNFVGLLNPPPVLQVSSDGQKLLAWVPGSERFTTIKVLELATGNQLLSDNDRGRSVSAVAFTPDGKKAAVGAADGTVRLYALGRSLELRPGGDWFVFEDKTGVSSLAYSPDQATLIVGSDKGDVKVCDVARKQAVHAIKAHGQAVSACAVSHDTKRFATVGNDNVVKLWDLASGQELRHWDMHLPVQERGGFVSALAFTPDGRNLITANANTTLYVLELP
jgi:WD40 repeat protein